MVSRQTIRFWLEATMHSYTQVFFSKNKVLGLLLLTTTFFDLTLGLTGLLAVVIANLLALGLGFDKTYIREGSYGFNALLVGLGLGLFYEPNTAFYVLLVVAMLITVLVTIAVSGVLAKYGLPYLSIPFLVGLWSVLLAARGFEALGLSQKGVYLLNELYASGEDWLVNTYHWFNTTNIPAPVLIYLKSLGAILFQFNALSGVVMAIGLLIYSRIAFSLSLLSFLVAYYFYWFIGADIDALGYSYIGFNFILSGIALGSFFLVPSKTTYFWSFALIPAMVVLTAAVSSVFTLVQLGIYSLPFNIVVLTFLYVLKLRLNPNAKPEEVRVQLYSPEKNLYERLSNSKRYANFKWQAIGVPFFGEWWVSQGHNGAYTHKDAWQQAWDFVIVDEEEKQYRNSGDFREDYYCYDKPVLAPADGTVEEVLRGVEDNTIGDANLHQNWGNTLVIKHGYQLYSQLSHLKDDSIKVKKGDTVKKGDVIAHCGNSGRSPYPHLHFQIQPTPYIGSKTMPYPLSTYLVRENDRLQFKFFAYPQEKTTIKRVETNRLMTSAFHFIPGRTLTFAVADGRQASRITWEVKSDIFNHRYLYCHDSGAKAYFVNDGTLHYFTLFEGPRDSLLYYFFIAAYKVLLGYYHKLQIQEQYPLYLLADNGLRLLHDFTAPFFQYMKAHYALAYLTIDDDLSPTKITLAARAQVRLFNKIYRETRFTFEIEDSRFALFTVEVNQQKITARCVE